MILSRLLLASLVVCAATASRAADVAANDDAQFRAALRNAKAGDHIRLGVGPFQAGGFYVGMAGTAAEPIRISGPSPERPAVFGDDKTGILQLVGCSYVEIENLHVTHCPGHALSFDDGGKNDFSCHHITLRHIRIDDDGPKGTACSIKMAGVGAFAISDCTFQKWGEGGGCAIDGVGCKDGSVDRCTFLPGRGSVAIQFKGGSENIDIRRCFFDDPCPRGINLGGSTDMQFFRPKPMGFEARNIRVEGNVFVGCDAPVIFANTDGAEVRLNTIYMPRKWAFRILQETDRPDFTPSRNGRIEDNLIVFKSTQWYEGGVNVGPGTAAESFKFAGNAWYCADKPVKSKPTLPSVEVNGVVGRDPMFVDAEKRDFSLRPGSPAAGKGADGAKGRLKE